MIRNQNNFSNYKLVTLQLTLKLGINEMFCVLESSRTLAVTYNKLKVLITNMYYVIDLVWFSIYL
jgi:hypothetical protein